MHVGWRIAGELKTGKPRPVQDEKHYMWADTVTEDLQRAGRDANVKAVVLRIDTPGASHRLGYHACDASADLTCLSAYVLMTRHALFLHWYSLHTSDAITYIALVHCCPTCM